MTTRFNPLTKPKPLQMNIRITSEMRQSLNNLAKQLSVEKSSLIRFIIQEGIDQMESEVS